MNLNRKGYVLVEIILASVIAFGIAYYMLDLTIKLKNKNDDLLAKTLVKTDRAIIQNKLYENIYNDQSLYTYVNNSEEYCNALKNKININGKVITYGDTNRIIDSVNKYTIVDDSRDDLCTVLSTDAIRILIPLTVEPLNESFDVTLDYVIKYPPPL